MKLPFRLIIAVSALLLTACGGSDSNSDPQTQNDDTVNQAPKVEAGDDIAVEVGQQAILTGSATDDGLPNGRLTYFWEQASGPGKVMFGSPDSASTSVVFDTIGEYLIRLNVHDGVLVDYDTLTVTVTASTISPSDQVSDSGVEEHSSGLRLSYDPATVSPFSTDIDWMFRLWNGIVSCQGGEEVPYPTINLVDAVAPREEGDRMYEEVGAPYKWNYTKQQIDVLNSDTAISKGSDQGLFLGEAISVYMGFYQGEGFPDPGSRNGFECHRWHAGGRWEPTPVPPEFAEPTWLHEASVPVDGTVISLKSDNNAVDVFTLQWAGELFSRLYSCHGNAGGVVSEILAVTERSADFHGDRWSQTGAYRVKGGGRILIDAEDLKNIRSDDSWGTELYAWINRYLDASRNGVGRNFECADQSGIFYNQTLPFDLSE